MNQSAQGVQQLMTPKFSDDQLLEIQQNAITSISILSTTFVGILQAFQNQANKKNDLERQIQEMKYDLDTATGEMRKTTKSMQSTVDIVTTNLQKQSDETDQKLQEMRDELAAKVSAVNDQSSKTQQEIYEKMNVTESRMNSTVSDLELMTDRIKSKLSTMESEHENLKSEITDMASEVRVNMETLQSGVRNSQSEMKENVETMNEKFQMMRFEVDQLTSTKADVQDLKWKVGMDEYSEWKLYLETALSEIQEQRKENKSKYEEMSAKSETLMVDLTQQLADIKQRHQMEVEEIHETHRLDVQQIGDQIGETQTIVDQLLEKKDFDDDDVLGMVHDLRDNMQKLADRIPRKKEKIPAGMSDDPSCTTLSGNCWSCGTPFKPKLKFSSKIKSGGGFNPKPPKQRKRSMSVRLTSTEEYITEIIDNDSTKHYGAMRVAVPNPRHKGSFKRSKSFHTLHRPTTAHL